jgi:hypothetical protein
MLKNYTGFRKGVLLEGDSGGLVKLMCECPAREIGEAVCGAITEGTNWERRSVNAHVLIRTMRHKCTLQQSCMSFSIRRSIG